MSPPERISERVSTHSTLGIGGRSVPPSAEDVVADPAPLAAALDPSPSDAATELLIGSSSTTAIVADCDIGEESVSGLVLRFICI
jgi:hypothetical protein